MAYVPVPKDLSKIKTKLAFNLTKRQLVCFSSAAAVGLPACLLYTSKSPEEQFREAKAHCFRVLADYLHLLRVWKTYYAPHSPEEAFHPWFVEALQKQAHVEYLLDILLFGETEEKAALIADYGKDVIPVSYTHLDVYKRQVHG